MHSVLLVVQKPEVRTDNTTVLQAWNLLPHQVATQRSRNQAIEVLSEGVLCIPLDNGLPELAAMVTWCVESRLAYRTLFFEKKPEWIVSIPKAL